MKSPLLDCHRLPCSPWYHFASSGVKHVVLPRCLLPPASPGCRAPGLLQHPVVSLPQVPCLTPRHAAKFPFLFPKLCKDLSVLGPHQPELETKVARLPGKHLLHSGPWLPPPAWGRNVPPGLQTFFDFCDSASPGQPGLVLDEGMRAGWACVPGRAVSLCSLSPRSLHERARAGETSRQAAPRGDAG